MTPESGAGDYTGGSAHRRQGNSHSLAAWSDAELDILLDAMRNLPQRTPDQDAVLHFLEEARAERVKRRGSPPIE